jgi:2-hydroxychromene-2-carboxylate isomerase
MRDDRRLTETPIFFFGAMSPFSWLAAERIDGVLPGARWRGVLAGAIFKANGRVSWGLTEGREQGMSECESRAAARGLGPIRWPEPWPTSDLLIARAMLYAARCSLPGTAPQGPAGVGDGRTGRVKELALAAMRLAFLEGADLGDADVVLEAGRRVGIDAAELRRGLEDPGVKGELRTVTDGALAMGVFGVPTIAVGDRLFWGDDRLEDAAAASPATAPARGRSRAGRPASDA